MLKSFLITLIVMLSCITTVSAQEENKTLTNSKNEVFINITDFERYTIECPEYDAVTLTDNETKKSHIFYLEVDCYKIKHEYYFKQDIIEKLNLKGGS